MLPFYSPVQNKSLCITKTDRASQGRIVSNPWCSPLQDCASQSQTARDPKDWCTSSCGRSFADQQVQSSVVTEFWTFLLLHNCEPQSPRFEALQHKRGESCKWSHDSSLLAIELSSVYCFLFQPNLHGVPFMGWQIWSWKWQVCSIDSGDWRTWKV